MDGMVFDLKQVGGISPDLPPDGISPDLSPSMPSLPISFPSMASRPISLLRWPTLTPSSSVSCLPTPRPVAARAPRRRDHHSPAGTRSPQISLNLAHAVLRRPSHPILRWPPSTFVHVLCTSLTAPGASISPHLPAIRMHAKRWGPHRPSTPCISVTFWTSRQRCAPLLPLVTRGIPLTLTPLVTRDMPPHPHALGDTCPPSPSRPC